MDYFEYQDGRLYGEQVDLAEVAQRYGSPCYVYSRATLERHWQAFDDVFRDRDHLVCYAVKANSNLAVLNVLARLGSGFDIVSLGELQRVVEAGGDPSKTVFSGVGKTREEMRTALRLGIHCFNVESAAELESLDDLAGEEGRAAPVALRVNPDVDSKTHPYIATGLRHSKFGIPIEKAPSLYDLARRLNHIEVRGVDCHIGSQLTSLGPFIEAVDRVLELVAKLADQGVSLAHVNFGGGLGIRYRDETPPQPAEYAEAIRARLGNSHLQVIVEPGRAIAGNAGILLTRVVYLKPGEVQNFLVVDAAMNDLLRPALYDAWHEVLPLQQRAGGDSETWEVVGPVCESGDFLGHSRKLNVTSGDVLAVRSVGAYGFVMSSNYNSRPRAPEVMVDGDQAHLVRARERTDELFANEFVLPH